MDAFQRPCQQLPVDPEMFGNMPTWCFIDYFIVNEVSRNVDGYRPVLFHKNRESAGGKIMADRYGI